MPPFDPATIGPPSALFGLSTPEEGAALCRAAQEAKGSVIEIGSYCGYSTLYLAYGIKRRRPQDQDGAQVFAVDTFGLLLPVHEPTPAMQDLASRGKPATFAQFTRQCKDHGVWDIVTPVIDDSSKAWRHAVDRPCGMLFVDGDHSQALRDFRQWSRFLEPGATVCFHDYDERFAQVKIDVDALVVSGEITFVERVGNLAVCRLKTAAAASTPAASVPELPKPRSFPKKLYQAWLRHGSPCPGLARFIRYRLLGSVWPPAGTMPVAPAAKTGAMSADTGWERQYLDGGDRRVANVAVVIPCHNYANYLGEAVESALAQTVLPREVLVVDDASTDDTHAVAASFAERGVKQLRGEWKSVAAARNAGALATTAPYLVFLDADDVLPPDYLDACLRALEDPSAGIAYGDMQEFGDRDRLVCMPEFDRSLLQRRNYISAHAMIRRQAFETVGGYRELRNAHHDWDIAKRITALPWTARKADTAVRYRVHGDSMLHQYAASQPSYAHRAGLLHEPVTIFTPFAGRTAVFDRYVAALKALDYDPALIRLHWLDTSGKPEFETLLRTTAATLPFGRVTYSKAPLPALWNQTPEKLIANRVSGADNARHFYQMAVIYVYNHMLAACDTEFLLTLEDDIVPEAAALKRMLSAWREDTAAVVASYPCRFRDCVIVWSKESGKREQFKQARTGVEAVSGSGFGCSLFRTSILRVQPIRYDGDRPDGWYDDVAFAHMRAYGKILCDWDIKVDHMES